MFFNVMRNIFQWLEKYLFELLPVRTMGVNKKRQIIRQSYASSSSMEKALRSAKRSKKSLLAISREFGVGYNALRRRVRGEVDPKAKTG